MPQQPYTTDLAKWQNSNIFLNNEGFSSMQMSLVPIKILNGSYETYSTQIKPHQHNSNNTWRHIILLPGTAFKFSNKLNAEYTARSIIAIMEIKNIPTKIHAVSHRLHAVFPEAAEDTLEMIEVILEQYKSEGKSEDEIHEVSILTWSAGCCHLEKVIELLEKKQINIERVFLVSPVVDLENKERPKSADFLSRDFFEFVLKEYCKEDVSKVVELSILQTLKKQTQQCFLLNQKLSIIYGSQEYIREDIQKFIELLKKLVKNQDSSQSNPSNNNLNVKCFTGQNHALYSFVTSKQTQMNKQAMEKIARTKWLVSKYIADQLNSSSD